MKMLMIDNYDSFTFNLVQLFEMTGFKVDTFRNDQTSLEKIKSLTPDSICISPGPKSPDQAGISKEVITEFYNKTPILGVCLGMQAINEVFGGKTIKAPKPVHGKTSRIKLGNSHLFIDIPSPMIVARYHSLVVSGLSESLEVISQTTDNVIMAIQHVSAPLFGVQFHPESFMTNNGELIARNFYRIVKEFQGA